MEEAERSGQAKTLGDTVGTLAAWLERGMSAGDLAALRRLRPEDMGCAAFWRITTSDVLSLPASGPALDEAERRWACVIQAMAVLVGLHRSSTPLGRALATGGVTEARVDRLLRSSGPALADALRVTGRHLAQKAVAVDQEELAALVLSDGGPRAEPVRRRIARSYYRQLSKEVSK